jgi:hypothetical protein
VAPIIEFVEVEVTSQTAAVRPTRSSLHSEPLAGQSSHASSSDAVLLVHA